MLYFVNFPLFFCTLNFLVLRKKKNKIPENVVLIKKKKKRGKVKIPGIADSAGNKRGLVRGLRALRKLCIPFAVDLI